MPLTTRAPCTAHMACAAILMPTESFSKRNISEEGLDFATCVGVDCITDVWHPKGGYYWVTG